MQKSFIASIALAGLIATSAMSAVAQGRDDHRDDHNRPGQGRPGPQNNGNDFRFRDQDRNGFGAHYNRQAAQWRNRPNRPHFNRGDRIPPNYRFTPVPRSYWGGAPPPPPGYQYGYYDGYVVAYNPATRIIGDVLDLAAAATR